MSPHEKSIYSSNLCQKKLDFTEGFKDEDTHLYHDLINFLLDWVVNHLFSVDKGHIKCFNVTDSDKKQSYGNSSSFKNVVIHF